MGESTNKEVPFLIDAFRNNNNGTDVFYSGTYFLAQHEWYASNATLLIWQLGPHHYESESILCSEKLPTTSNC
jgi:hypothetical protein